MVRPVPVALSLGSNLGDRRGHLEWALPELSRLLDGLRHSAAIETEPFDVPDPQPPYLNMAAVGETTLEPVPLVLALLDIERRGGRERRSARAARTLDLDLIFYGSRLVSTPDVVVPHPRFRERRFVLEPLASLVPDWIDPMSGLTVEQLLRTLEKEEKEKRGSSAP